ncbi:MAG: PilZ domain-containing protein [Pseudomonadota bacterium]
MSKCERRGQRRHFRGKPRPGRRVEVSYRVGVQPPVKAYTRNIGIGGAFIVTPTPPPPGTTLVLSLGVATSPQPIEVKGEVRWQTVSEQPSQCGMGVKFYGLEVEQLVKLSEYFASLTGRDEETVGSDERR